MKYEGGLREEILAHVGPMEIRNFPELVNKSRLAEEYSKKLAYARMNRREVSSKNIGQNLAPQGKNFKSNGSRICYNCGRKGHLARDCRNQGNRQALPNPQQQGKVFAIMTEGVAATDPLIQGDHSKP